VSAELSIVTGLLDLLQSNPYLLTGPNGPGVVSMLQQARRTFERAPQYLRDSLSDLSLSISKLTDMLDTNKFTQETLQHQFSILRTTSTIAQGEVNFGIDAEQLRQIAPNLSRERALELVPHINAAMRRFDISSPQQQAMFLAHSAFETRGFRDFRERGSAARLNARYDSRAGNVHPGDGSRFRGRGAFHLTCRLYYRAIGEILGMDLESNPELVERDDVAFLTAAAEWTSRRPPSRSTLRTRRPGHDWTWIPRALQGRTLNDIAQAGTRQAFDYISVGINPGIPYGNMRPRGRYFEPARRALGLVTPPQGDLEQVLDEILAP
jgi:predicted chitinase